MLSLFASAEPAGKSLIAHRTQLEKTVEFSFARNDRLRRLDAKLALTARITGVMIAVMAIAHSKLTSQGQISVPAEVRRKLGLGPGSVLEWEEQGDAVIVRRVGQFSSAEIHHALFDSTPPEVRSLAELKESVRGHVKARHARR